VEWRRKRKPGAVGRVCALWRHSDGDCDGSYSTNAPAPLLLMEPPDPPDAPAHPVPDADRTGVSTQDVYGVPGEMCARRRIVDK